MPTYIVSRPVITLISFRVAASTPEEAYEASFDFEAEYLDEETIDDHPATKIEPIITLLNG